MKASSWRLRRRSTGHLPQDVVQQLAASSNQHPPRSLQERTRSVDILMTPIDEHPHTGSSSTTPSPQPVRKSKSSSVKEKNEFRTSSVKMASGTNHSGGTSGAKKKKTSFASLMPPVIGSRSASPVQKHEKGDSPSGNDTDSISSRSSASTLVSPRTPLPRDGSFSYADLSVQRDMTYEEELELRLHKVTGAAQEWKGRFMAEHEQCSKINNLLLEREREYKSILQTLTAQYDSQITEVNSKLFDAISTADALMANNNSLGADLRDLQERSTREVSALKHRLSEAVDEVKTLTDYITAMQEKCRVYEDEKTQLVQANEALQFQLNDLQLSAKRTQEMHESENWSEYYKILLELALDKLRCFETEQEQQRAQQRKDKVLSEALQDANSKTPPDRDSYLQVPFQMDTRSVDSITSFESLLSDITDSMSSSRKAGGLDMVDFNDNITHRTKNVQGSPRPSSAMARHSIPAVGSLHVRQVSEPLSSDQAFSSSDRPQKEGFPISYSDGNLPGLEAYIGDECEQYEDDRQCLSHPMPTLVEVPSERSLERKREQFVKSYSDEVPPTQNGTNGISMSDSNLHHPLPVHRVLSDGATEVVKKISKSPTMSPQAKLRAHAKKAGKHLNLIKRWQAGELERPKFPWRRRHTHDAGVLNKQLDSSTNTNSLPKFHDSATLQEKLNFISKTRSQEDLLDLDNLPQVVISRSGSITSASSGSVDFDLDPTKDKEDLKNPVSTATQSGFERLRVRRNGVAHSADMLEMRKSPSKGGKGKNRPKSVDTVLDSHNKSSDLLDVDIAAGKQSTKHKFFRKKSRSVKK